MNKQLTWIDDYKIGNKEIDYEHEEFFLIAKNVYSIKFIKDKEKQIRLIKIVLNELCEHTSKHFNNEENLMKSINYPDLKRHMDIHKEISMSFNNMVNGMYLMETEEVILNLTNFTIDIFINHIKNEDAKISNWINK